MLARRRPARYLLDAIHRAYQPRAQIYSISPSAIFHRPTAVHSLLSAASFCASSTCPALLPVASPDVPRSSPVAPVIEVALEQPGGPGDRGGPGAARWPR
ncbi:MAG: hypothetical protein OXG50_02140 [bacterium]|nr:hypothetical protein [bacterium]